MDDFTDAVGVFCQSLLILEEELFKLSYRKPFGRLGFRVEEVLYDKGFINAEEQIVYQRKMLIFDLLQCPYLLRLLLLLMLKQNIFFILLPQFLKSLQIKRVESL